MDKSKRKNKKRMGILIILLALIVLIRFFGGIYKDDEFQGKYFFIKNKPTWKWSFHSPRAMSDTSLEEMSEKKKNEQILYDQYIPNRIWEFPIPFM